MTCKNRLLSLFALVLMMAPLAQAEEDSHRAAAESLFEVLNMEQILDDSISQSLDLEVQANPGLAPYRDTMREFFERHMSYESLHDELIDIYTDTFAEDELRELIDFYETPVGRKATEKMPEMYQKGAQIGMARVQNNIGELQQMIAARAEEIEAEAQAEQADQDD